MQEEDLHSAFPSLLFWNAQNHFTGLAEHKVGDIASEMCHEFILKINSPYVLGIPNCLNEAFRQIRSVTARIRHSTTCHVPRLGWDHG